MDNNGTQIFGDIACVIGFLAAIMSFCCNSFLILTILSTVFCILGICMGRKLKGFGIVGIVVMIIALVVDIARIFISGGLDIFV